MTGMIKLKLINLSEAAILAVHAIIILASNPKEKISLKKMEKTLSVSGHHLSKVMQKLVKAGIVNSTRGPAGGFKLKRKATEITLLDILEIIEGQYNDSDCLFKEPVCINGQCALGSIIHDLNSTIKTKFENVLISSFAGSNFFNLEDPKTENIDDIILEVIKN